MSSVVATPRADRAVSDAGPGSAYVVLEPRIDGVREQVVTAPALPEGRWSEMYRAAVTARAVDQEAIYLQRQGHLGVYASSRGQEAIQVATATALAGDDWLFPSYRELGAAVARGLPPEHVLHPWRGTWFATHDPVEHRFGLLTIPLATQTLHAVGFALAGAHDDVRGEVVACFLGDGATSEGDAHEAWNLAAVFGLPVVFVVQNNGYAISVPVDRQTRAASLAHKAVGYGMAGFRCDGNDLRSSAAAVDAAVDRARRGDGPSIVEALTYRMEAHTTSDDPSRYRDDAEVASWRARDPIEQAERGLRQAGVLDDAGVEQTASAAAAEAARVRHVIESTPPTDPEELFEHVLATPSRQLRRAREEVRRARTLG